MDTKKVKKLQLITRDDLDVDVMAEVELSRLQRQYRIMDGDREAYVEEINVKLAKQKKVFPHFHFIISSYKFFIN